MTTKELKVRATETHFPYGWVAEVWSEWLHMFVPISVSPLFADGREACIWARDWK